MARRRKHEEDGNHEAWAIPYGDLVTLLLAFFVVMYAISSVNENKYRVVAQSLSEAFGGPPVRLEPLSDGAPIAPGVMLGKSSIAPSPIQLPRVGATPRRDLAASREQIAAIEHAQRQKEAMQQDRLGVLAAELEIALSGLIDSGDIAVRRNPLFLEVEMRADILFGSGSAVLQGNSGAVVQRIGATLAPFPNPVKVEGHTDNQPIASFQFPSNWELSAARAASVVKLFVASGVASQRVAVVGYGAERPKAGNQSEQGRNLNRRVVLVILAEPEADEVDDIAPPAPPASSGTSLAGRGTDPAAPGVGGRP
jgi:chemotaxis protein MotB